MAPVRCCFDQTAVWHSDAARGPSTPSFNHLVGARLQREWNGEPQRLRGLEIDHQFEFRGLLDRQVGRLFAFENPPGVDAGEAIRIGNAGSVTDQPAGHYKLAQIIHGRHGMARRQLDQLIAPAAEECIAVEDYRVDTLLGEARKSGLDFAFAAGIADQKLNAEGVRCSLDVFDLRVRSWIRRIDEKTDQPGVWDELAQQFQPFCREWVDHKTNPRDIAAGSVEAGN